VCLAVVALGCTFGTGHLERGHLAYNAAIKRAADDELLLNIVRVRYLDTLDFMTVSSVSSQVVFSVSVGAAGGSSLEFGNSGAIGRGEIGYSTRPTFTFTPQRGKLFARQLVEPVALDLLTYLVAADWDINMLFRLLVRGLNGVENELGLPNPEFRAATGDLGALQMRNSLFVGFVPETRALSDPIGAAQVSGADLVAAAEAGLQFRRERPGGPLVLTSSQPKPVIAMEVGAPESERLRALLGLVPEDRPCFDLVGGTRISRAAGPLDTITVRTRSLLGALVYLAQGVEVPEDHVEGGSVTAEFPPGEQSAALGDLFTVRVSGKRPDAALRVKYRGHWFFVAPDDVQSRVTFFHLAELFRLGLSQTAPQEAPVLTLPVGG